MTSVLRCIAAVLVVVSASAGAVWADNEPVEVDWSDGPDPDGELDVSIELDDSVSLDPPLSNGTMEYTLPLEKATIRLRQNLRHVSMGA